MRVHQKTTRFRGRHRELIASLVLSAALACASCSGNPPAAPTTGSLVGRWVSALAERAPCVGDWSRFEVTLTGDTGELVTRDGARFSVAQVVENGVRRLDVTLPPGPGECQTLSFTVASVERDGTGLVTAFSGQATGRCCGTIAASYRMVRQSSG
jgi:hypothetical protein